MAKRRQTGPAKLPVRQLAILAAVRFAEPLASTSVFPYLPQMIESFNVDRVNVAKWAGITSAVFSLSQCATAIGWGRLSDRFGRKSIILIGLTITMFTSLFWGFSSSLTMAIVSRALSGGGNGNVGIIRTVVAELVKDNKELQPRAFSIMPLVWTIGSIFGPAFGGFLAQPSEQFPGLFGNSKLLIKFPFLLPNLVAAVFFMGGIIIGFLFLKETHETKKKQRDIGLELGTSLMRCVKRKPMKKFRPLSDYEDVDESSAALLRPTSSSSTASKATFDSEWHTDDTQKPAQPPPGIREVFTRQSTINLVAYTFLALHSVAFDQLLPIFMHHPVQVPDENNTHLPFKFSGGFGLEAGRIGTFFTLYGVVGGFVQFVIFPPVARRFGVLRCLKACCIIFPFIFFAVPYTALIQDSGLQQAAMFGLMIIKSFAVIFAFPCSTILLTNSAVSLRILGTLNGFATSVSAVGRAAGPAIGGACFTWGARHGYIITPWWTLGVLAAFGAIPVWYLVEMDGFNAPNDDDDEEDEDEETLLPDFSEEELAIVAGDEVIPLDINEEAIDTIEGPPLDSYRSRSRRTTRTLSVPKPVFERRLSSPIGLRGVGPGAERRLSTGLGASNVGAGAGGTTFN